jgi:hypothetical protein
LRRRSDEEFVCSAVGIDRFEFCHISYGKVSGKAKAVNNVKTTEWLTAVWPHVRGGYADSGIFNAEETGIFFRLTLDVTLNLK